MQYVTCQNGYRPLPHWVTQFRMKWTCWYRRDDHSYFADQLWSHLAAWESKSCISTGNIFWVWNLFRRGLPLAGRSAPTVQQPADHVDDLHMYIRLPYHNFPYLIVESLETNWCKYLSKPIHTKWICHQQNVMPFSAGTASWNLQLGTYWFSSSELAIY